MYSYQSNGVSDSLLKSDAKISVKDNGDYFLFEPKQKFNKIFIFYPGAMVDSARISREKQQNETLKCILGFIN